MYSVRFSSRVSPTRTQTPADMNRKRSDAPLFLRRVLPEAEAFNDLYDAVQQYTHATEDDE